MSTARSDPRSGAIPIDHQDQAVRDRLSADAPQAFLDIMVCWRLSDDDACKLLGVSSITLDVLRTEEATSLNEDQLERINCLAGIFKTLNIILAAPPANQWVRLPNTDPPFAGSTPLDYLIRDGLPAFTRVRRLLNPWVVGQ